MHFARLLPLAGILAMAATAHAADDLGTLRSRLISLYAGHAGQPGEKHKAALNALVTNARALLDARKAWPDPAGEKAETLGPVVAAHYRNITLLAQAFVAKDSPLAATPELKSRIEDELKRGLQWTRPGSPRPGNWYQWLILIPQELGPTLALLEGKIDPQIWKDSLAAMADLAREPGLSGANAVWEGRNHLYLGLLQRNPKRIALARNFLGREVSVGGSGSGILEDLSFQFHGPLLHTSGYGGGFAYSAAEMAYLCENTQWAFETRRKQLLARHFIEHARWVVINTSYDLSVRGRGVLKPGGSVPHCDAMLLLSALDGPDKQRLQAAANGMIAGGVQRPPLTTAALADAVADTKTDIPLGFRHFYATDFSVFRRPTFYASVRMYSNRLIDYEGNWNQNLTGWFLCYGLTCFSRTGDELWRPGGIASKDYDWDRLPGTTVRAGVQPPKAYNTGTSPFAGGAGGQDPDSGGVCGFILQPAAGGFEARKSYHFFDRGFVALGSGITSKEKRDEHVITTITQWVANDKSEPVLISGNRKLADGESELKDVRWVSHDGVGYAFFEPTTLMARRRGVITTLWLDHGAAPKDAKYAYAVLPAATVDETQKFAVQHDVAVIKQDGTSHAVVESARGALGAIFWQAGEIGVTADRPVLRADAPAVLLTEGTHARFVDIANPLHTSAKLNVAFLARLPAPVESKADEMTVKSEGDVTQITVATANGRSYRAGFGAEVTQPPRENYLPAAGFKVQAESVGDFTTLTVRIPESQRNEEYQLVIRGPQGHLRATLTDKDVLDRPAPGTVRYRWNRQDLPPRKAATPAQPDPPTTFTATIFWPTLHAQSPFTVPAPQP